MMMKKMTIMMIMTIISETYSIFKLGTPNFVWLQIQIAPTDNVENEDGGNHDDDYDDDGEENYNSFNLALFILAGSSLKYIQTIYKCNYVSQLIT